MSGLGTIVNVAAILGGCVIGLLVKGGLPKHLEDTITSAVGLCVVFVGITGALKGLMTINGGSFETQDTLVSVVCMVALPWVNGLILSTSCSSWGSGANPGFPQDRYQGLLWRPLSAAPCCFVWGPWPLWVPWRTV